MPSGDFWGGFSESFLKTLLAIKEQQRQEAQFKQEMDYKIRQMNLLNTIQQKQLDLQNKQFGLEEKEQELRRNQLNWDKNWKMRNYWLRKQEQEANEAYKDKDIKIKQQLANIDAEYKRGLLENEKKRLNQPNNDNNLGDPGDDISIVAGEVARSLMEYDNNPKDKDIITMKTVNDKGEQVEVELPKSVWRQQVGGKVTTLLHKVGLSENLPLIQNLWRGISDKGNPIAKRNALLGRLEEIANQGAITPRQYDALKLYIEVKTR